MTRRSESIALPPAAAQPVIKDAARAFYARSMDLLEAAEVPFVVGGGFAMATHANVSRNTKDLDLFIRQEDCRRALAAFEDAGYRTERTWPHFLVKALSGEHFVDLLYNSANGICPVDEDWFTNAAHGELIGRRVLLCPAEEMIWQKMFVMDRDRFDGADVAHLIRGRGDTLDWERLIRRVKGHERVMLSHLLLFGYIFPPDRDKVPGWVVTRLINAMGAENAIGEKVCRGVFLSKDQYKDDVCDGPYADPRLKPLGPLTPEDVARLIGE